MAERKPRKQIEIFLELSEYELLEQMFQDAQKHCGLVNDMKRKADYKTLMSDIALQKRQYWLAYSAMNSKIN